MRLDPEIRHEPDPDHPGWWIWEVVRKDNFNWSLGKLLVRAEGKGRATCRMFPAPPHANLAGRIHGGALLAFIDMAFFSGGWLAGADVVSAVTLGCDVQFLQGGRIGPPLDAEVELLRETGRLVFLRGKLVQEDALLTTFSGTLRKATRR